MDAGPMTSFTMYTGSMMGSGLLPVIHHSDVYHLYHHFRWCPVPHPFCKGLLCTSVFLHLLPVLPRLSLRPVGQEWPLFCVDIVFLLPFLLQTGSRSPKALAGKGYGGRACSLDWVSPNHPGGSSRVTWPARAAERRQRQ